MAINCEDFILADIQKDCLNPPKGGLEYNVVLIKHEDIDRTATTIDGTNPLLVTNLALKAAKTGYLFEGLKSKTQNAMWELVKTDYSNAFKHQLNLTSTNNSAANSLVIQQLLSGGKYVAVIQPLWKGASNADGFIILGYNSGLEAQAGTRNFNENSGVATMELASEGGNEEGFLPYHLKETDYATTLTAFNAKFAS
jgi:hypothetical protein